MNTEPPARVRIIPADRTLQTKVGTGPLSEPLVRRCQTVMEINHEDFEPLARHYLVLLDKAIAKGRAAQEPDDPRVLEALILPVMHLKANAGFFRYGLVSILANIVLGFLESLPRLDSDALDIIEAHGRTLSVLIEKKLQGPGGLQGEQIEKELREAIKRYKAKVARPGSSDGLG